MDEQYDAYGYGSYGSYGKGNANGGNVLDESYPGEYRDSYR